MKKPAKEPKSRPVYIRLPMALYKKYIETGKQNQRTLSAEIVYRLIAGEK